MILTLNNRVFKGAELLIRGEKQKRSGVYVVINDTTGEYYIGKSKDIIARISHHLTDLKGNSESKSQAWLDAWNENPDPSNYSFFILYESDNEVVVKMVESNLIKTLEPAYNSHGKPNMKRSYQTPVAERIEVYKDGKFVDSFKTFGEIARELFNGTRSEDTTINRFSRIGYIATRGKFKGYEFRRIEKQLKEVK